MILQTLLCRVRPVLCFELCYKHLYTVASAPTELKAVQKSSTSILVSWHPSTDATGYIISYTGARSSGSVTVSDGSTDNYLVSGLQKGDTYTISNIATSRHFFSVNMTVVISLGEVYHLVLAYILGRII